MGIWKYGRVTYWNTGNPPGDPQTFCEIGWDNAYDHSWTMVQRHGSSDDRDYNAGCHSWMVELTCGQTGTSVWSGVTDIQIDYVRTVDAGPCLRDDVDGCSPELCNEYDPKLIIDVTPAAFQALGYDLSDGWFNGWVFQP